MASCVAMPTATREPIITRDGSVTESGLPADGVPGSLPPGGVTGGLGRAGHGTSREGEIIMKRVAIALAMLVFPLAAQATP